MKRIPLLVLASVTLAGCVSDLRVQTVIYRQHCLNDSAYREETWTNRAERDLLRAWDLKFEAAYALGDDAVQLLCNGLKQSLDQAVHASVNNTEVSDE